MTDLLVQRLKAAKRELTALKTAHRRGLGGLKVFEKDISVNVPASAQSGYWFMNMTINFDTSYPPYPFAQITPPTNSGSDYKSNILDGEESKNYDNNGYTLNINFPWRYQEAVNPYPLHACSSSPIVSYSVYFWGS